MVFVVDKEIADICKEFGKEDIDDIKQYINQMKDNKNVPATISTEDIVYNALVKNIIDKNNECFQTYRNSQLCSLIVKEIENHISISCDVIDSIIGDINALSETTYESSLCKGNLTLNLLSKEIELLIKFEKDEYQVDIDFDKKGIGFLRKLLQIAQKNMSLVVNKCGDKWIPIGYADIEKCKALPTFAISGPLSWTFSVADEVAIFLRGKYIIRKSNEQKRNNIIDFLCGKLIDVDVNILSDLVERINGDKDIHGALLVFIDDEQQQVINKLCKYKRGIKISENSLTNLTNKEFLDNYFLDLCKIDGAVVFNKKGQLLSIGTILDGCVISPGDVGRGSRYNSTKTFVEYYSQPQSIWADEGIETEDNLNCIGLVISEDKNVNLIFKDEIFS